MRTQTNVVPIGRSKAAPPTKFCVVVGLDFTDADGPAFDLAAGLAMNVPGSALHVVHVFHAAPSAEMSQDLATHLRGYVNQKGSVARGLRGISLGIHLRAGRVVSELVQLASDVLADILVVGSHEGPEVKDWIAGSTVERLVSRASFPVLVASARVTVIERDEMVIEPACADCVREQAIPGSAGWWCERHAHKSKATHTFSYRRDIPPSPHDAEVIPTER